MARKRLSRKVSPYWAPKEDEMFFRKFGLLAVLGFIIGSVGEVFVLNFKVVHEAVLDCPNKGTNEIQLGWKLRKVNRTLQVMYGPINFLRDVDDSMSIRARLWTWQNGGWKAGTGLDFKKEKACTTMALVLGKVWTQIMAKAQINPKCPWKKGNYTLEPIDARIWDNLPLPGAPVNKYKLEYQFESPDGKLRGCYSSVFKVSKK